MMDFLYSLDVGVFRFVNVGLSSWLGDQIWPVLTDYDKIPVVRIVLVALWLLLVVKGGKRGRTAALMLIVVLIISDQFSSFVVKPLVERARPCHFVNGVQVVQDVHLIVGCGGGKSFPSSHAVNNFALGTMFALFYPRWKYAFWFWASIIALSRVFVGVHYPSDIVGGAIIGSLLALLVFKGWETITGRWLSGLALTTRKEPAA
jgi:undecaprenyl-diphosphatase